MTQQPTAPGSLRRWWALPAAVLGAQFALLGRRAARNPLDVYGDQGAEYIEHFERLRVTQILSEGHGPWWQRFAGADGAYPPGLHAATLPLQGVVGLPAESLWMAAWPWLVLLVAAVGALGWRFGGERAGVAAATATAALPVFGAVAGRYYYDLPMVALLFASTAALAWAPAGRRGAGLGGLAGLLAFGAAVVKWTALPFGGLMLAGAWMGRRSAAAALAVALGLAIPSGAFLAQSSRSWSEMMFTLAEEGGSTGDRVGSALDRILSAKPPGQRASEGLVPASLVGRAGWYAGRLPSRTLSWPVAVLLVLGVGLWGRRRAPGAWVVGAVVAGHSAVVLLLVPPLDDRFLLTLPPALALAGALGWATLRGRRAALWAVAAVAVGLGVAADFHGGGDASWWSLNSSWEQRGWARAGDVRPSRRAFREALWAAAGPAHPDVIAVLGVGVVDPTGEEEWWRYRALRAEVEGARERGTPLNVVHPCEGATPLAADVVVGPATRVALDPRPWCPVQGEFGEPIRVADPDGGIGALVWVRP